MFVVNVTPTAMLIFLTFVVLFMMWWDWKHDLCIPTGRRRRKLKEKE